MDLDLARIYGTPGIKTASAEQEEAMEKQAQAELFAKLAADNGIDLSQLSDEQISGLWSETFGEKLAEEGKDEGKDEPKEKAEKDDDDEEKKAAAAYELALLQDEQQKLAFADQAGRVMAHAMVQELNSINEAAVKEAGMPSGHEIGRRVREGIRVAKDSVRDVARAPSEALRHHRSAQRLKSHISSGAAAAGSGNTVARLERGIAGHERLRNKALKTTGKAVGGAALVGGGAAAAASKKKESSALDELALESAYEKAASAGFDTDEAAERLLAVATLGLGDSEKIASAPAGDLDTAVEIRSLEYLEAAGYPVEWA